MKKETTLIKSLHYKRLFTLMCNNKASLKFNYAVLKNLKSLNKAIQETEKIRDDILKSDLELSNEIKEYEQELLKLNRSESTTKKDYDTLTNKYSEACEKRIELLNLPVVFDTYKFNIADLTNVFDDYTTEIANLLLELDLLEDG